MKISNRVHVKPARSAVTGLRAGNRVVARMYAALVLAAVVGLFMGVVPAFAANDASSDGDVFVAGGISLDDSESDEKEPFSSDLVTKMITAASTGAYNDNWVVQVADANGKVLVIPNGNSAYYAMYGTLEAAVEAMYNGSLYYQNYQNGWQYVQYTGDYRLEMLCESCTVDGPIAFKGTQNVTITTATKTADGNPISVLSSHIIKGDAISGESMFTLGGTGKVTFENVTVDGNRPSDYVPGYDADDEQAVQAAQQVEASVPEYGGLVYMEDGATLIVRNAAFTNGIAKRGGAVYAKKNARFEAYAGAVFSNNTTTREGDGGAFCGDEHMIVYILGDETNGVTFKNNSSGYTGGGAINLSSNKDKANYNDVVIERAYFEDNSSLGTGGAIRTCEKTNVTLNDVEFSSNLSVATYYQEEVKDKNGNVTGHNDKYSGEGGAIAVLSNSGSNASTLTIYGGLFQGNRVLHETADSGTHGGGAIKIGGYGVLDIYPSQKIVDGNAHNARLIDNSADNGGAIIVEPGATATIREGAEISDNTALFHGGAVYVNGSDSKHGKLVMQGGSVEKNLSYDRGGAVYIADTSSFEMSGGVITNNTSVAGGAVAFGGLNSKVTFTGSPTVFGNDSKNVYLDKDSNAIINVGSEGIADNALIGVYVFATQMDAHGTSACPFGTYANSANLARFINDRNGLTGGTGQNNTIIWSGQSFAVIKQWGSAGDYGDYEIDFKLYRVTGGSSYTIGEGNTEPPKNLERETPTSFATEEWHNTTGNISIPKPANNGFFEYNGNWYYMCQDINENYTQFYDFERDPDNCSIIQNKKMVKFTGRILDERYFEWYNSDQIKVKSDSGITSFLMGDILVDDGKMWLLTDESGDNRNLPKNYDKNMAPGGKRGNFTLLGPAEGEPGSGSTPDIDYSDQETAEKEKDELSDDGYDVDEYTDGSGFTPDKTETKTDGTVIYMGHYTLGANDNWMRTFTGLPAGEYYAYEVSVHKKGSTENLISNFDVSYQYIQDGKKVIMRNGVEEGDDAVQVGFKKVDSYGNALRGAEFALYTSKTETNASKRVTLSESGATTVTSNANGEVKLTLPVGIYYMREVSTPAGYNANGNVYVVLAGATYMTAANLNGSEFSRIDQAALNVQNNAQGSVAKNYAIFQLDDSGNAMAAPSIAGNGLMNVLSDKRTTILRKTNSSYEDLSGAQFTAYSVDWSPMELGADLRESNANGYALVKELNYGTYYLREDATPDGYGNNAGSYYKVEVRADANNADGTVGKGITVQRISNVAAEQNRNVVVTSGGGSATGKPTYEIRLEPAQDSYLTTDVITAKLQEMVNGTVRNNDFTDAVTWRAILLDDVEATIGVTNGVLQFKSAGSVLVTASIGGIPVASKVVSAGSPTALEVSGSIAKQPAGDITISNVSASDNGQDLSNSVEWHAYTGSNRATSTDKASVATKNSKLSIEDEGTYYLFARDPSTGKWSSNSIQFEVGADVSLSANATTIKPNGEVAFTVKYGNRTVTTDENTSITIAKQGGGTAPTVSNGKATFPNEGTYTVSATYKGKAATSTVTITVKDSSGEYTVEVLPSSNDLKVGDVIDFKITNSSGTSCQYNGWSWLFNLTSSQPSAVKAENGKVTLMEAGTYVITLTANQQNGPMRRAGDYVQVTVTVAENPLFAWQELPSSSYGLEYPRWGQYGQYEFTVDIPQPYSSMTYDLRITTNNELTNGWGSFNSIRSGNTFTIEYLNRSQVTGTLMGNDLQITKVEIIGRSN